MNKEQDAAHSFEKERCQYELWVKEYFGLPENFPERAMSMSFDYGQIVNMLAMFDEKRNNFYKQNVADVMFERDLELTRLRSELQKERELRKELEKDKEYLLDMVAKVMSLDSLTPSARASVWQQANECLSDNAVLRYK